MLGRNSRNNVDRQKTLRNDMTDAERLLWRLLRGRQFSGLKFRRQHPFHDYYLDFVCLEKRLVIEVDGSQHLNQGKYDRKRTDDLAKAGFKVMRLWNHEVLKETESVKEKIWRTLEPL